ncbi:catechol dioxygenase [Pseudohyphozyma bogoriensis]|nr:catechol dioxygenase [Pseudohyphozyma bogoriensis]
MSAPNATEVKPKKVGKAIQMALDSGAPNVDLSKLPNLTDLSADSLCDNVIAINSLCENPRLKFVFEKLVTHVHQFAKEVSLTTEEWMAAIQFLTATGQICTDIRQEFILLSDILGLSALVDTMNHPVPEGATESTVLGPFFTEDAKDIPNGGSIASEGKGEYMFVKGRVTDLRGNGIAGCKIETWETDDEGLYDTQYEGRDGPDCRGRITTDADGYYWFRGVRPVAYPIPNDGPVGKLLRQLSRHVFRPAHLHMLFEAPGYESLITSLYPTGSDPYIKSDAVFGVKSSLLIDYEEVTDEEEAKRCGFPHGPFGLLKRDFVLITTEEAEVEKRKSLANYYASLQVKK